MACPQYSSDVVPGVCCRPGERWGGTQQVVLFWDDTASEHRNCTAASTGTQAHRQLFRHIGQTVVVHPAASFLREQCRTPGRTVKSTPALSGIRQQLVISRAAPDRSDREAYLLRRRLFLGGQTETASELLYSQTQERRASLHARRQQTWWEHRRAARSHSAQQLQSRQPRSGPRRSCSRSAPRPKQTECAASLSPSLQRYRQRSSGAVTSSIQISGIDR